MNATLKAQMKRLAHTRKLMVERNAVVDTPVALWDDRKGAFYSCPDALKTAVQRVLNSAEGADFDKQMREQQLAIKGAFDDVSGQKMTELNAFRTVQVSLLVRMQATSWREMFFDTVTLLDNERPRFVNTYQSEVDAIYAGPDYKGTGTRGGIVRKSMKAQAEIYPELFERQTEPVGNRIRDIYNGDVSKEYQSTYDLSMDAALIDDLDHYNFLVGGSIFGSFTTTGSKIARTFVASSRIRAAALPSTNVISATGDGKLKLSQLKSIRAYTNRWGNLVDGSAMAPTGILIVPADQTETAFDEVTVTGSTSNKVADGVLNDWMSFNYLNTNWVVVPNHHIPQNSYFVQLNRKVGWSFEKPSQALGTIVTPSDPQQRLLKNWEERTYHWNRGIATTGPRKVGILKVNFA